MTELNVPKGFSLEENEKPVWYGRMSWKANWFLLLLAILTAWPFGIGIVFLIIGFLRVLSTEYFISTKRIFVRYGLFKKTVWQIRNEWISSYLISQGFFGKIFNYGRVWVSTPGYFSGVTVIKNVSNPSFFKTVFDSLL
ncbi:MAG: PH domain-containing protein [Nitrososphaeria archaeon]